MGKITIGSRAFSGFLSESDTRTGQKNFLYKSILLYRKFFWPVLVSDSDKNPEKAREPIVIFEPIDSDSE